jgi:hypothetical protein
MPFIRGRKFWSAPLVLSLCSGLVAFLLLGVFEQQLFQPIEAHPTGTAWVFSSYFYSPGQINSETFATSIARDSAGNIYFAGNGDSVPLKGSVQYATGGSFAAEFAPDGKTLIFSTLLGGNIIVTDTVSALQVGPDGTIYLAGSQIAQDFPYTVKAYRARSTPLVTRRVSSISLLQPSTRLTATTPGLPTSARALSLPLRSTLQEISMSGEPSHSAPFSSRIHLQRTLPLEPTFSN